MSPPLPTTTMAKTTPQTEHHRSSGPSSDDNVFSFNFSVDIMAVFLTIAGCATRDEIRQN
jgi:hypothetical protein